MEIWYVWIAIVAFWVIMGTIWWSLSGSAPAVWWADHRVKCPNDGEEADVQVMKVYDALDPLVTSKPTGEVVACDRFPDGPVSCEQGCLAQCSK